MSKLLLPVLLAFMAMSHPLAAEPANEQKPAAARAAPDCGRTAMTCSAIKSCAEACGYLEKCGLGKLDRDKDGIPCESMCTATCDARS